MEEKKYGGLPVAGYRAQSGDNVATVNGFKRDEERILRKLDALSNNPDIDKRWLAIGRTSLEQAFMAINRSVFKPNRVTFPEGDAAYEPTYDTPDPENTGGQ